MEYASIQFIQNQIKEIINKKGGRITYEKDLSKIAQMKYKLSKREPIVNLEALMLGEKFGIVIGYPDNYEKIVNTDKFKIFHIQNADDFNYAFQIFINQKLCKEAIEHHFAAVCVPPNFVADAKEFCLGSEVKVATVIGFPFGYSSCSAKKEEIIKAINDGADELDMVINISDVKSENWVKISKELSTVLQAIRLNDKVLKVIIESGILTEDEIIKCCEICEKHRVDYVKTSTGYAEVGARLEDVQLMRKSLAENIKIKASGGIRDYNFAKQLIDAGADRIGASASVVIVNGAK